jgi:hypothetical protein
MTKEDVNRFVEYEAPGIGIVENDPAELVCFRHECEETVEVHPLTLVPEDDDAVDVEAGFIGDSSRVRYEIYCSGECRNKNYDAGTDRQGGDL